MSQTIKFANGSEFTLASAPYSSGKIMNLAVLISGSTTVESVNAVVTSYANTKTFQISNDGTYSNVYSYYALSGNVQIDSTTGYCTFILQQKDVDKIHLEDALTELAKVTSALDFMQIWVEKKIGG